MGTIEGIFTCSTASGDMVPKPTVALIPGVGLEGDRYAGNIGTYSALPEPGRQLTMISADSVEAALSEEQKLQLDSSVGRLRRNVVLRGLSGEDLCNAIGSVVQFGSDNNVAPLVFVHRNCVPCMYNERRNKVPDLMDTLWKVGGVSCEIIRGGSISLGDTVKVLSPEDSKAWAAGRVPVDGGKPEAFYVRPKERSAEMVKGLLEGKKRTKQALMETDKDGLLRLQRSYESVGLQY